MVWKTLPIASWWGRVVAVALVSSVFLGLFGIGVLLSGTYGAAQVAGNARELHWTNATLGASGITRAAVAQAVFFSFDDVSDQRGSDLAMEEATLNLDALDDLVARPETDLDAEALTAIEDFIDLGRESLELARSGNPTAAETVRLASLEPLYDRVETALKSKQAVLAARIADSDRTGGRISRITIVAMTFAIPALAMILFWLLMRRRLRVREEEMRSRLQSERELLDAKDEFIAGLSHELRTPLTTIVGFSEVMLENESLDDSGREQLTLIHEASSDLSRMVGDLLTAARLDADALTVQSRTFDLADAVTAAARPYLLSGEPVELRVPSIAIHADPLHVRQVVHNLISNALRHGGERVLVSAAQREAAAFVVVADNGPGVPPEVEKRLFQRFVNEGRSALVAGSVGLGLAISQELARRMGGTLEHRRDNGWTFFSLRIPLLRTSGEIRAVPAMSSTEL